MKLGKPANQLSLLERFIVRLDTQREVLEVLFRLNGGKIHGDILEVGLGSGRTYDHIRKQYPNNRVIAFDYKMESRPEASPNNKDMILGEIKKTLPKYAEKFPGSAGLIHLDIGGGNYEEDSRYYNSIGSLLTELTSKEAWIASDRPLAIDGWEAVDLSGITEEWSYFLLRKKN